MKALFLSPPFYSLLVLFSWVPLLNANEGTPRPSALFEEAQFVLPFDQITVGPRISTNMYDVLFAEPKRIPVGFAHRFTLVRADSLEGIKRAYQNWYERQQAQGRREIPILVFYDWFILDFFEWQLRLKGEDHVYMRSSQYWSSPDPPLQEHYRGLLRAVGESDTPEYSVWSAGWDGWWLEFPELDVAAAARANLMRDAVESLEDGDVSGILSPWFQDGLSRLQSDHPELRSFRDLVADGVQGKLQEIPFHHFLKRIWVPAGSKEGFRHELEELREQELPPIMAKPGEFGEGWQPRRLSSERIEELMALVDDSPFDSEAAGRFEVQQALKETGRQSLPDPSHFPSPPTEALGSDEEDRSAEVEAVCSDVLEAIQNSPLAPLLRPGSEGNPGAT